MANEKRLIDANALCEFFQERYEYLRNASEKQLPNGYVQVDVEIQCGAIIAKEFLDKAKDAPTVDVVEVVHGRWEYGRWNEGHWENGNERCRCSVCQRDFAVDNQNIWHGCPQCLARMDLPE